MDRTDIYDRDAVLQRYGSEDRFKRQIPRILAQCDKYDQTLRRAIVAGDAHRLERTAYRMGSALGKLSAGAALDIALHLERQGRMRELSQSPQTLDQLEAELDRLKTLLNQS